MPPEDQTETLLLTLTGADRPGVTRTLFDTLATVHPIVLDVEQIRRWAPALGHHVTSIAIEDARHDVVLSLPGPRQEVYRSLGRWLGAWVEA